MMKYRFLMCMAIVVITVILNSAVVAGNNVVDFESLVVGDGDPLPAGYAGLDWDTSGQDPQWWSCGLESAEPGFSEPHSGDTYVYNRAGVNNLGFSLPDPDGNHLLGAWFTKTNEFTPDSVRFIGLNSLGDIIQSSDWLSLSDTPQYLSANFSPCNRIEVEHSGTGPSWYTMDDVTYAPEPATIALLGLGGIGLLRRRKR